LNEARQEAGYVALCYGSSQKMVNMVFKYLACYSDYASYADYFKYCHMPIDTVILRWLKDNYNISDIKYYIYQGTLSATYCETAWTKFGESLYRDLLSVIRQRVSRDSRFTGHTLLEVEFLIWY
jgi:hypothetical protein